MIWFWEGPVHRYFIPTRHWRSSRELSLWLLHKGTVELLWEHGSRRVTKGHWIMPTPFKRNERFSADAEVLSLRMDASDSDGTMLLRPRKPLVFEARSGFAFDRSVQALREYLCEELGCDPQWKIENLSLPLQNALRLNTLLSAVFAEWVGRVEAQDPDSCAPVEPTHSGLQKAVTFLEARDLSRPLREADVAMWAGVSLPHLRRLFRRQLGSTIKGWDARRLARSVRQALAERRLSAKEVAYAHGFSSPSHFSRWFRKQHHCTPGAWLKGHRPDGAV
jgi:AraC-like DNA-binding protein